jgi:site-specific recombinase XerD
MRVSGLDKQLNLTTGIVIEAKYWDKNKEKVKTKHPRAYLYNKAIEDLNTQLWQIIEHKTKNNEKIDREAVKASFRGKEQRTDTLFQLYDYFLIQQKDKVTHGTYKHYKTNKTKLLQFLKAQYKKDDVDLKDLDYSFVTKYKAYLDTHYKNHPNTAAKEVKRLKAVINYSIKLQWMTANPFSNYKCSTVTTNRGFLTPSEITQIENYLPKDETEALVKDCFLLMTYTGLSYSDTANLSSKDIQLTVTGKQIIKIHRQKTSEYCMIPVLQKAATIINKYKDHPISVHNNKVLPVLGNAYMNKLLKRMAPHMGITKRISCHLARHSFATNALEHGVPIETVSKALGHSSIKTTQIYAKITETKLTADFEAFDKAITDKTTKEKKTA